MGGPRSINVETIINLRPDLIVANQEENERSEIEELTLSGIPVWMGFPKIGREALDDLFILAGLFRSDHVLEKV